jgi:hypothetical protein
MVTLKILGFILVHEVYILKYSQQKATQRVS